MAGQACTAAEVEFRPAGEAQAKVATGERRAEANPSQLSWSAYLLFAILWFLFGIHKRDPNIYLPCIGWMALDAAVIVGAVVYRA